VVSTHYLSNTRQRSFGGSDQGPVHQIDPHPLSFRIKVHPLLKIQIRIRTKNIVRQKDKRLSQKMLHIPLYRAEI
jgi:hypothetical protein